MELKAFSGYFYDTQTLLQSASGGGATAIAQAIISRGGCVFGVKYTDDFRGAEYFLAQTLEELDCIKGSKYIESDRTVLYNGEVQNVYRVVEQKLTCGIEVLFIGLGCTIAGLYSYLQYNGIDTAGLYTLELICHGPTTKAVARDYCDKLEKKYKSKLCSFTVRHKKHGWTPPYLRAEFENGKVFEKNFYHTDYGFAFSFFSRPSCYNCKFRAENHKADICIGDFWGTNKKMPCYNKNGVSVFIVQNEKGVQLLDLVDKTKFHLAPADLSLALSGNPMYLKSRSKPANYDIFAELFRSKGLHYAIVHYHGIPRYLFRKLKEKLSPLKHVITKLHR